MKFSRSGLTLGFAVMVGLLVSTQSVFAQTAPDFEDVPQGHVAEAAIEWAAENGITVGVGNNRFGIGQTLIRYQMVTFLCRAFNPGNCLSGTKGSDRFADVPADHWANYSVGWAVNQGITSGVSATEFGGSQTLTREQMITFLYRAIGKPTGGPLGSDIYQDVPDNRRKWANLPIGWAFDQGITGGISVGTFGFGTNLSREEMVLFFCRTLAPGTCQPSQDPLPSSVVPPSATATDSTNGTTAVGSEDCDFTDHVAQVAEAVYQVHAGESIGTAFYIGNDEWLTAAHVVQSQSTVTLRRGSVSLTANVLAKDFDADLALLQAEGSNIGPLRFGNLSVIGQGHQVFSVGFPVYVASEPSVTRGVLSRIESHSDLGTVVVTDAAVSPGNSGGPLLNECGEVIGLFVGKIVGEAIEGISYAVAESTLKERLPVLRREGSLADEDDTGPSSEDVGDWMYFSGENIDGKYEGYELVAVEHDGHSWEFSPHLLLRCGIANVEFDDIFIVTDWLIQSDIGDDGDVVVEYRFAHMTSSTAEWWGSDEEVDSVVFVYGETTQFIEHLRRAKSGSLWVRIWDGFSEESNSARFEIDGAQAVLSDLSCLN